MIFYQLYETNAVQTPKVFAYLLLSATMHRNLEAVTASVMPVHNL